MINAGSRALGQFRIRTGRLARTARAARTMARARARGARARARETRVPSPGTRRAVAVARRRRAARRRRSAQLSARALAQLCATHTRIPLIPHPSLTHTLAPKYHHITTRITMPCTHAAHTTHPWSFQVKSSSCAASLGVRCLCHAMDHQQACIIKIVPPPSGVSLSSSAVVLQSSRSATPASGYAWRG